MVHLGLLFSLLLLLGCQSAPPPDNLTPNQLRMVQQEIEQARAEISEDVTLTIRNEIMPELREIQLGSKKLKTRNQQTLKKKVFKKIVIGRVEWITSVSPEVSFRARIDTGAQTCSIHAEKISEKNIDGEKHVEFTTLDEEGKPHRYLKKVVEMSRVKGTSGIVESRYVVKMTLMFGKRELDVNVNLNNRKNLRHRFLVGRNLLLGDYIVDVSQSRLLGDKR